jgi:hypothetical protein
MATPTITDRGELDARLRAVVQPGSTPQPYTSAVLGMNSLLQSTGTPIPPRFGEVLLHNVTMAETRQISSPTAHLNEVRPLFQAGVDHYRAGNYSQSAICLSGAAANLTIAPMLSGAAQKSNMNIGKY